MSDVTDLKAEVLLLRKENKELRGDNAKLMQWCNDFWKWADPPFALKSGMFDEYMTLVERAINLGIEVCR